LFCCLRSLTTLYSKSKVNKMKKLTQKEEEIMNVFWEKGPMFVKELKKEFSDQKLHYNTLSTMVRGFGRKRVYRPRTVWKYTPLFCRPVKRGVQKENTWECGKKVLRQFVQKCGFAFGERRKHFAGRIEKTDC
jgi:BlaI family transcriptional regulator, penicillinase repressor